MSPDFNTLSASNIGLQRHCVLTAPVSCRRHLFEETVSGNRGQCYCSLLLQAELVTQLLPRTDGYLCYRFRWRGGAGDLTTKLSKTS